MSVVYHGIELALTFSQHESYKRQLIHQIRKLNAWFLCFRTKESSQDFLSTLLCIIVHLSFRYYVYGCNFLASHHLVIVFS